MSPQEAIAECQQARVAGRRAWSVPLLAYLNDPPGNSRLVAWLCSCVSDLLVHFGRASAEFDATLSLAHRYATGGGNAVEVEQQAWKFWLCPSPEYHVRKAVAQLLFALARSAPTASRHPVWRFAVPICLLEGLESSRGEVFDRVVAHFTRYTDGPVT